MDAEAISQLAEQLPGKRPTHLFLQAGVGSMAASVLGFFVRQFAADYPVTVIAEPDAAACMYMSAQAGDGEAHVATGDLRTTWRAWHAVSRIHWRGEFCGITQMRM